MTIDLDALFNNGPKLETFKLREVGDEIIGKITFVGAEQEQDFATRQNKYLVYRPLTDRDVLEAKIKNYTLKGEVGDWAWKPALEDDLTAEIRSLEGVKIYSLPQVRIHLKTADKEVRMFFTGDRLKKLQEIVKTSGAPGTPKLGGLVQLKAVAREGKKLIIDGLYEAPSE